MNRSKRRSTAMLATAWLLATAQRAAAGYGAEAAVDVAADAGAVFGITMVVIIIAGGAIRYFFERNDAPEAEPAASPAAEVEPASQDTLRAASRAS